MKRIVFLVIIAFFTAGAVFGQNYTVRSITGQVQRESGSRRVNIRSGETLSANTVIHTALGASIVLRHGDIEAAIPAVRSGRVADLFAQVVQDSEAAPGAVNRVTAAPAASPAGQVSTASARARVGIAEDDAEEEEEEIE